MSIIISKERLNALIEALEDLSKGNYTKRLDVKVAEDCFSNAEGLFNILAEDYENKFKYFISLQSTVGYEFSTTCILKISSQGQIRDISFVQGNDKVFVKEDFIDKNVLDFLDEEQQEKWLKNFLIYLQVPSKKKSFSLQLKIKDVLVNGYCGFHYMDSSKDIWVSFAFINSVLEKQSNIDFVKFSKLNKIKDEELQKLNEIKSLISNNEYEKIYTIEELSKSFDINKAVFQKGFKLLYGQTFYAYYLTQRINHAKELLVFSNLSIQEIAVKCGFSDYSNFFRNFQKVAGVSPAQYRKQK